MHAAQKTNSQIVVVGSHAPGLLIHVHRHPKAGETVMGWDFEEAIDGGKGSNQAIAAAKLGVNTAFVGFVGQDRLGEEAEKWMREVNINLRHLYRSHTHSTGVGFITLDDEGVPAMVTSIGANEDLDESHVEQALADLHGAMVLLTQFEIRPEVALYAAQIGRQHHMCTIVNPAPACAVPLANLNVADILTPNETEAKVLLGYEPEQEMDYDSLITDLRAKSEVSCVIITLGEQGVIGMDSQGIWRISPPQVKVVDTSGAGDAFCAALAVAMVNQLDLRSASDWACKTAALSVTRPGTIPAYPTLDEVNRFLAAL